MNLIKQIANMQGIHQKNDNGGNKTMELTKRRMKVLFNQKGLTLIELLAVIVILAIISAIAIPAVGGLISGTRDKAHDANAQIVIGAARYKVMNETPVLTADTHIDYSLELLKAGKYLDAVPIDPKIKNARYSPTASFVRVSLNEDGNYAYAVTLKNNIAASDPYLNNETEDLLNGITK